MSWPTQRKSRKRIRLFPGLSGATSGLLPSTATKASSYFVTPLPVDLTKPFVFGKAVLPTTVGLEDTNKCQHADKPRQPDQLAAILRKAFHGESLDDVHKRLKRKGASNFPRVITLGAQRVLAASETEVPAVVEPVDSSLEAPPTSVDDQDSERHDAAPSITKRLRKLWLVRIPVMTTRVE
ncbi:unnamed protein product [Peniophora sp. CBMAI 1063]|nr:unnamed protein product [Peniophora sp. CBMAI 1063]